MKVKVIRGEGNEYNFESGWVTEGVIYKLTRKHPIWDDGYYILDNDGDETVYWDYELEFVED